jgi:hypothetical protein
MIVALLGHFKGETGIGYHMLPVIATTPSDIESRKWIVRVIKFYQTKGITHGPVFQS